MSEMTIVFPYMARWNSANMSRYYHLFKKIAESGHTIIVVQPPPRISDETNYIDIPMQNHPNIILFTVGINSFLWDTAFFFDKFFKKAIYTLFSYFFIKKLIRRYHPNVMVVYNLPQYIYTFLNVPIVFDYADDYIAMLRHELGVSQKNFLCRLGDGLLRRLIRKSILVTSVSNKLNTMVEHKNKVLIPNGADISNESLDKTILHIDKSKPVIGYIGAFEYFIDLDLMVSAAEHLPNYTFLLVGAGREFSRIKEQVLVKNLSNVILTGAVPHRQAMQFVSEMDICLNLFKKGEVAHAASPIKLFEYIAKERPVITTRLDEIERIDRNGCIFSYADTLEELSSSIALLLEDSKLRNGKIRLGLELIKSGYNWDHLALLFVQSIKKSIDNPANLD